MSLEAVYMISQVIAALAVIVSLVFLGLQIKKADATQRAIMHEARTKRALELQGRMIDSNLSDIVDKARTDGRHLTAAERRKIAFLLRGGLINTEETLYQYNHGLLEKEALEDQLKVVEQIMENPVNRLLWKNYPFVCSPELAALVEKILNATTPAAPPAEQDIAWRALWDAEFGNNKKQETP